MSQSTTHQVTGRRAARQRTTEKLQAANADRDRRDQEEADAAIEFDLAVQQRYQAEQVIAEAETRMGAAIRRMTDVGSSLDRVAAITERDTSEVRRLRKLAHARDATTPAGGSAPSSGAPAAQRARSGTPQQERARRSDPPAAAAGAAKAANQDGATPTSGKPTESPGDGTT